MKKLGLDGEQLACNEAGLVAHGDEMGSKTRPETPVVIFKRPPVNERSHFMVALLLP